VAEQIVPPGTSLIRIKLEREIEADLAADLQKNSVYISDDLLFLKVEPGGREVAVGYAADADLGRLTGKVDRYLKAMIGKTRRIATTVHYRRARRDPSPLTCGVEEELKQRDWLFEHGRGQASLAGPPMKLIKALDDRFATLYHERFSAVDRMYPAMVGADLLARCGYFESHPNAATFVSHFVEDFDELETFRLSNSQQLSAHLPSRGALALPHYCLNPAACFPCYESFQGRQVGSVDTALTWQGRVFRYESRNLAGLDRLWEFNVRELVFLGSQDFVFESRERMVALVKELADEWDLDCRIETATDAFFPTVYSAKSFWQKVKDVKFELCLAVEPASDGSPRTVAAGSMNLHGPFFGERFGISLPDGAPASSGCVGWGLERWVLALFCQHGFDPERWPASLRTVFD
jgi:seryl-tRNA synthetase